MSSECRRDMSRVGEDAGSCMGVVGNKNPKDASEVGEEDCKVMFEALDAEVSVRARVNLSSLEAAVVPELFSLKAMEGLPLADCLVD